MRKMTAKRVLNRYGRELLCAGLALQGMLIVPALGDAAERPKPINQMRAISEDRDSSSEFRLIQFTDDGNSGGSSSIGSAFKKAGDSISGFFKSEPREAVPENDPISLSSMPDEIGPNVFLSAARMMENSGNAEGAERQYKKCLDNFPDNRVALISYARLLHRTNHLEESLSYYQKADKAHPKDAVICNDMGLCLARMGRKEEAMAKFHQATVSAPEDPRYRNNMAMVLVDAGRNDEALSQLVYAHGKAKGHFNLGVLLYRKGNQQAAADNFHAALQEDSTLSQAKDMLARMDGSGAGSSGPSIPAAPKSNTMFISDQPQSNSVRGAKPTPADITPAKTSKLPPTPDLEAPRLLPPIN